MTESEIRTKLTSEDLDTLNRSLSFVDNRLALIRERAKLAETRATAMLAVSGIVAGFVVNFGKTLVASTCPATLLSSALYFSSIILFAKAIVYAIKVLWVIKGYELNADLVFDLQGTSGIQSLKEELTWKIWEYWQTIPWTTEKLFWLNRSQRNTVSAIFTFMFLGLDLFIENKFGLIAPSLMSGFITMVLVLLVLFLDFVMEGFGAVWQKEWFFTATI